jgi:carbonic anhydrase
MEVGELFVIRNAGNIIPPFGAANGGEGAAIEYAIEALNIDQIIICGHSNCGAMKGLLKIQELEEKMPLVYQWLKHAEPTRRVIKENYQDLVGEELLTMTTGENVLAQLNNLQTYPSIRSRLHQGRLSLHGWMYDLETGIVLAYDPLSHQFIAPQSKLTNFVESEFSLHPACPLDQRYNFTSKVKPQEKEQSHQPINNNNHKQESHLTIEQAERIYRGTR